MNDSSLQDQERLVLDNQGLVVTLAKRFNPPNATEFEEYKQAGNIGLWKASKNYDPSRGVAFSTMAWACIRNEIIRYLKNQQKSKIWTTAYKIVEEGSTPPPIDISDFIPDNLTEKEKDVLYLRYEGWTFSDIGKQIGGLSKGGASNIFKKAVKKIRQANPNA